MVDAIDRIGDRLVQKAPHTDLFNLTPGLEMGKIADAVATQEGTLPVFVHPLFHQYDNRDVRKNESSILDLSLLTTKSEEAIYLRKFSRFLQLNHPVILLVEEAKNVASTVRVMRAASYKGEILTLKTQAGKPDILKGDSTDLAHKLTELGVKEIVVGGTYGEYVRGGHEVPEYDHQLHISYDLSDWQATEKIQHRGFAGSVCVGGFMRDFVGGVRELRANSDKVTIQKMTLSPIVF